MIEQLLISSLWLAVAVGLISYAASYALAFYETALYLGGISSRITLEGQYSLSSNLVKAVEKRRYVDVWLLLRFTAVGVAVWAARWVSLERLHRPEVFSFLLGGLVLIELADCICRLRNISFFRLVRSEKEAKGQITFSRHLVHTLTYAEFYYFAGLFLVIFLVSGSWFVLGGMLSCFLAAQRHRDWTIIRT